ncbi:hypothetical protein [Streptomyces cyaneogriseus]|uniref:hypothetical protein n=1 Tax=Streptomyces cyaneogriseus TaxID=68192 RepID=UPI0007C87471|nr:hypothetical protein [Streptomyces cyaneogriseus]
MGTAERRETPGDGGTAHLTARWAPGTGGHTVPASRRGTAAPDSGTPGGGISAAGRAARAPRDGGPGGTATREAGTRADAGRDGAAREADAWSGADDAGGSGGGRQPAYRSLWVEEPARRRRLPDPVRTAAVRAVLVVAVTLIQAMVAFLSTLAGSWLAFPMVLSSVASTVAATWAVLDVWVTRQVWNQRHGVVSTPSSTARALRRERRRARRQARAEERAQERIRRRGGAGQLSHP